MILTDLETRTFQRLEEDVSAPTCYTAGEVIHALNQAYYLFVLLTLCLEKTVVLTLPASTAVFGVRGYLPDYLLPLRLMVGSARIRPASIRDLDAIDATWQVATAGPLKRYGTLGMNLFLAYPPPTAPLATTFTYAYIPAALAAGGDVPLIPENYHESLIKFAIPWLRLKEGAQEFNKSVPLFKEFLADAGKLGNYVRVRSRAAGYDQLPMELDKFDMSRLFQTAPKRRPPDAEPTAG